MNGDFGLKIALQEEEMDATTKPSNRLGDNTDETDVKATPKLDELVASRPTSVSEVAPRYPSETRHEKLGMHFPAI